MKFRILFHIIGKNTPDINSVRDFILGFEIEKNGNETINNRLLDIFKLRGRYVFHKRNILDLISKYKDYSESQVDEFSNIIKIPSSKIKSDIFGRELFEGAIEDKSFTKVMRDIAKQIGIDGVL